MFNIQTRKYFLNSSYNKEFNSKGYLVIDFLNNAQLKTLDTLLHSVELENQGFHSVKNIKSKELVKENSKLILELCSDKVKQLLCVHNPVLGSFLIKKKQSGALGVHLDPCFSNDEINMILNIWIPLTDVDHTNGNINIIPQSHLLPNYPRAFPISDFPEDDESLKLYTQNLIPVPMKKGQALIFPLTLIHNSSPNFSEDDRPAISLACIVKEEELCIWKKTDRGYSQYLFNDLIDLILIENDVSSGVEIKNITNEQFEVKYSLFKKEMTKLLKREKWYKSLFKNPFVQTLSKT